MLHTCSFTQGLIIFTWGQLTFEIWDLSFQKGDLSFQSGTYPLLLHTLGMEMLADH